MTNSHEQAIQQVLKEARLLDEKRWDEWLSLYTDDAVFWMPSWRNENELTQDPNAELSFIYLEGKSFFKERVERILSGMAPSALLAPRTCHLVSGLHAEQNDDGLVIYSSWVSHIYEHKNKYLTTYCGRYEHEFIVQGDTCLISRKKVIVINDYLMSQLDFYYI